MTTAKTQAAFLYTAAKAGGQTRIGLRAAKNRSQLAEALRKEKLQLRSARQLPRWAAPEQKLRPNDHLVLNEQLAALLSRGVPLVEALEVAGETVSPIARPLVDRMRDLVASGSSFSDACRSVGSFDSVAVAVYRAAERSGDLAGSALQLATTLRRTLAVTGRAVTLMIYPAIVLTISFLVAFGMMTTVVPKLAEALKEFGEIPWFSRVVMKSGEFMADQITLILLLMAAAAMSVVIFRRQIGVMIMHLARRTPLLSDVMMAQEAVRVFSVMAAMSRSGVPLADALGVANQAITHPVLRRQMERLRTKLIEGGTWRVLIEEVDALPLATRKLLIAAERAGDLEAAFNSLALDMTEQVDRRSTRFLAVLQPLLIVLMFVIIGSLLTALLIPLITIGGSLGK